MRAADASVLPVFRTSEGEARYREAYDAVLRQWPVAYQELDIPTRYASTHVIVSGAEDAPPLVLLPSMAGSATLWRPNIAALSSQYRTYAVDVIGQAGKSQPARRMRTRQQFAEWYTDLLDGLGIPRAPIVGSSYGGFLALNQAILTPERVGPIALINPAGCFVGGLGWVFLRGLLLRMLGLRKKPAEITDLLGKNIKLRPDDARWAALMRIVLQESARPNLTSPIVFSNDELRKLQSPVMLLIGADEVLYKPQKALRRALEGIPGLRGEIIPGAHHLAALAQPEVVNARLLVFFSQQPKTDANRAARPPA